MASVPLAEGKQKIRLPLLSFSSPLSLVRSVSQVANLLAELLRRLTPCSHSSPVLPCSNRGSLLQRQRLPSHSSTHSGCIQRPTSSPSSSIHPSLPFPSYPHLPRPPFLPHSHLRSSFPQCLQSRTSRRRLPSECTSSLEEELDSLKLSPVTRLTPSRSAHPPLSRSTGSNDG